MGGKEWSFNRQWMTALLCWRSSREHATIVHLSKRHGLLTYKACKVSYSRGFYIECVYIAIMTYANYGHEYRRHADNMEIYCISGTPHLIRKSQNWTDPSHSHPSCSQLDSAIVYSNRLKVFALKDHLRDSSLSNLSLLGGNFLKFVPRVLHLSIKNTEGAVWCMCRYSWSRMWLVDLHISDH